MILIFIIVLGFNKYVLNDREDYAYYFLNLKLEPIDAFKDVVKINSVKFCVSCMIIYNNQVPFLLNEIY